MTVLKVDFGGVGVEIWFAPSFSIKTDSKELEVMLRSVEVEVFDPWTFKTRKVKATKGIREAYLVIQKYKDKVPEAKIKFLQIPELENSESKGTLESPVVH